MMPVTPFLIFLATAGIATTVYLSYLLNNIIARVAINRNWCDAPGTAKVHTAPVPFTGGIGIFLAWIIAVLIIAATHSVLPAPLSLLTAISGFPFLTFLLAAVSALLLGLLDDIRWKDRSIPIPKLTLQVILALFVSLLLIKSHIIIHPSPVYNLIITSAIILVTINALNLADGIDGLAGGQATISLIALAVILGKINTTGPGKIINYHYPLLALFLAAAVAGFLFLNLRSPSRLFLGDNGTHLLGALLATILIVTLARLPAPFAPYPLIAATLIIGIPLFDIIWVLVIRLSKIRTDLVFKDGPHLLFARQRLGTCLLSLFTPDRNHIYDRIIAAGLSPRATTILLWFLQSLSVATGITLLMLEIK